MIDAKEHDCKMNNLALIEHVKKRLGMYLPLHDGKLSDDAWNILLHELLAYGVRAFERGEATRLEIRCDQGTGEIAIGHDGPDGNMCQYIANALQGVDLHKIDQPQGDYYTRYDWLTYAILGALTKKMTVETYADGEWRATVIRDGRIGVEERLLSGLLPTDTRQFVWVRFVIDSQYLPEDKGCSPYSLDLIEDLGKNLACMYPGLRMVVNEREHVFPNGLVDVATERMAKLGSDVLMPARMVETKEMSLACGIVRRKNPGRRISGTAMVNGIKIKDRKILEGLMESVCDCLSDCRQLRSCDYEFVFVAAANALVTDGTDWSFCSSFFNRCLCKLLGEFMK